jgi:Methylase involved in ubiquinone/menaquinone biosynthesis
MERRKKLEKEFHNKIRLVYNDTHVTDTRWSPDLEDTIKNNPLWVNMKYYAIERKSRDFVLNWYKSNCKEKQVLDYCAGNGGDGVYIAKHGAKKVYGIDISDVSIENCKQLASSNGVEDTTEYKVADAENTGFENDKFDIITEYGALHHLDLDKAFSELYRIIKPNGKIICNESLAHNFLIHMYRKLTPNLRTEWEAEHILRKKDIVKATKYFHNVEINFFHLTTLLAVPFRKTFVFDPLLKFLEVIDRFLFRIPIVKWQAWQVVFVLSNPKK